MPGAGDSVVIRSGHTVTLNVNGTCGVLNVIGALLYSNTNNRSLTITTSSGHTGNLRVSGNFGNASAPYTGQFVYIAGSIFSTGVMDNNAPGTSALTWEFNGTGQQTMSVSDDLGEFRLNSSSLTLTSASYMKINGDANILAGTLDISTYTFDLLWAGGTLSIQNGATMRLAGTSGGQTGSNFPINFNSLNIGASSTIEYYGNNQTVYNASYGNLSLSGTSGTVVKTMPGTAMSIAGNFSSDAGSASSVSYTAGAAITFGGDVTLGTGTTFSAGTYSHSVAGNWTNNGTFNNGNGTVTFTSTGSKNIGGSSTSTFSKLTLNNTSGFTLTGDVGIDGTTNALTLTNGRINTGSNVITLASSTTISGSTSSKYINGNLAWNFATGAQSKTFPIGTSSAYTPVAISFANVTATGVLQILSTDGEHPDVANSGVNPASNVNRYWTATTSGLLFSTATATFNWVGGDVDGGASYASFLVSKYLPSSWTNPSFASPLSTSIQATGLTSFGEFVVGNAALPSISGNVFEDVNYGGGAGRSKAGSSGVSRSGVRVELYNNAGAFVTSKTTDGSGNYSFTGLSAATYYVRAVSDSVSSSRTGYTTSLKPVMTYRTNASSGSAVAVTDFVGGLDPATADATRALSGWTLNTSTGVFTGSGSGKASAFAQATITSSSITGVDFGFNFNTVTNKNDAGQGSLRQVITNMNTLTGDASLAQSGLVAAKDNAVFMISNGTSAAGLRSANNYFSGGVASIIPTTALPAASTVMILDAQKQPGWSAAPIIELNGSGIAGSASGFTLSGGGSVIRGFVINRFSDNGIFISTATGNTIQGNYIGTTASGNSLAGNFNGISLQPGSGNNQIGGTTSTTRNVICNVETGIGFNNSNNNIIQGNYIGLAADGATVLGNGYIGVDLYWGSSNTIGGTGANEGNTITGSVYYGIAVTNGSSNRIAGNNIYGSGGLSIDHSANGVTVNNGTKNAGLPNYDMDYPVFTSANFDGSNLTVSGYVGSAPGQSTFANARVEIFKSDNHYLGYGGGRVYYGFLTADASGNFSGTIAASGLADGDKITGTATDASGNTSEFGVNYLLSASVFYNAINADLTILSSWWSNPDGATGLNPANFTTAGKVYNITKTGSTMSAAWTVSGAGSKVVLGNGAANSFTIPASFAFTGTMDVSANATLVIQNTSLPTFGTLATTSTVNYASASSQTITAVNYGNLSNSNNGARVLASSGTIGVAGIYTPTSGAVTTTGSTLNYNGTVAQTVAASSYNNVTASNPAGCTTSGAVVLSGIFNVNENLVVGAGSTLTINSTGSATIASGKIFTVHATGTIQYNSSSLFATSNVGSTLTVNGTYVHNANANNIPQINTTWASGSLLKVGDGGSNITTTIPLLPASVGGSVIWNTPGLTTSGPFVQSTTPTISGNLTIMSTGSASLVNITNASTRTLTIGGDLSITGGKYFIAANHASPIASQTNVSGNISISGGDFRISNNITGTGTGALNAGGNISHTAGVFGNTSGAITGTLTMNGSTAQTLSTTGFLDVVPLTINNASGVTANTDITVGDLKLTNGTLAIGSTTCSISGALTRTSGNISATAGTVVFSGSSAQSIPSGTFSTNIKNLTVNNAAGITIGSNVTVTSQLTLSSGNITTGSGSLIISSTGNVSRTSGHVVGNFQKYIATGATSRTFEIGDASNYTPVDISFASVSVAGNLIAKTIAGDHGNIGTSAINSTKSVNRYWSLTNSGITFSNYNATFTFVAGDVDGGANTASFIVARYEGAVWTNRGCWHKNSCFNAGYRDNCRIWRFSNW